MYKRQLRVLKEAGVYEETLRRITDRAAFHLRHRAGDMEMGTVLFSKEYGLLGRTDNTEELIKKILGE